MTKLCGIVLLVNLSTEAWNARDNENKAVAQVRCKQIYKEEAPCLVKFIKMEPLVYRAICGEVKKRSWEE
jgi:hypothetical protein